MNNDQNQVVRKALEESKSAVSRAITHTNDAQQHVYFEAVRVDIDRSLATLDAAQTASPLPAKGEVLSDAEWITLDLMTTSLNDNLNEALADEGATEVSSMLQAQYSLLKKVARICRCDTSSKAEEKTPEELGYVPLSDDGRSVFIDGFGCVQLDWTAYHSHGKAEASSDAAQELFGTYIERDDGTKEFRRAGEAFSPSVYGGKVWNLCVATPSAAPVQPAPELWTVTHNGKSVSAETLTKAMGAARALRTEAEEAIAAENLMRAINEELQGQPAPVKQEPIDERKVFDKWHTRYGKGFRVYSEFNGVELTAAWKAWQARAAIAQPAAQRDAIIEECAKVCEQAGPKDGPLKLVTDGFVAAIRALAGKTAPEAGGQEGEKA